MIMVMVEVGKLDKVKVIYLQLIMLFQMILLMLIIMIMIMAILKIIISVMIHKLYLQTFKEMIKIIILMELAIII